MMYKLLHFSSQVLPASVCGGVEESNSTGVAHWHYLCGAIQMRENHSYDDVENKTTNEILHIIGKADFHISGHFHTIVPCSRLN